MTTLPNTRQPTQFRVLGAISFSHFLNDMLQSLLLALYPLLKGNYQLSFAEIGLLTFTYQCTASLLQPLVGLYTDKRPLPYSLVCGMGSTLCGLLLLASAHSYPLLLLAAALIGIGSSVFHPESSRVARMAAGGRPGLAQSIFQVGGNSGSASGPLLAALIVIPLGQASVAWFALLALLAMAVLYKVGQWYSRQHRQAKHSSVSSKPTLSSGQVKLTIFILLTLVFSKQFYLASISSYFTFYLIKHFGLGIQAAQLQLFLFLLAVAAGTILGGPIGDAIGRKRVIWFSILGVAPLTLLLPHVNLFWTTVLSLGIGFILASAFPAILIFAQELLPGRVGMVSGLFFGFAFGIGGIGAAILGQLADWYSIEFVYLLCSFLPLLGLSAAFLPDIHHRTAT
ncbi:MFS transporter [Neisseriaceae bacterium TC5R-5]|nr:MFS transporter [Neisseriaceae bacterium TC5R-5]